MFPGRVCVPCYMQQPSKLYNGAKLGICLHVILILFLIGKMNGNSNATCLIHVISLVAPLGFIGDSKIPLPACKQNPPSEMNVSTFG